MKISHHVVLAATALAFLASAAFAANSAAPKKWQPSTGAAESAAPPSEVLPNPLPATPATLPLRYTVNYATGCNPATQTGGTVISVINRRPYSTAASVNWVKVKFYDNEGQLAGETWTYPMGSPDGPPSSGANSHTATFATNYEVPVTSPASIGSSSFPWVDVSAFIPCEYSSAINMMPYFGYAEIYSSHPAIQVAAFGVSGTGNVTELPVRRAKLPTVGGH